MIASDAPEEADAEQRGGAERAQERDERLQAMNTPVITTGTTRLCRSVAQREAAEALAQVSILSSAPPSMAMSASASAFTVVSCLTVSWSMRRSTCGPATIPARR